MAKWVDRYWNSKDGLRLHYRDYAGPAERPPILCLPGLTRNARDFEPIADRFAGEWRVLAVDFRGRGGSEYDPNPANYVPSTYAADTIKLLDQLGIADAVFFGTSLGGIVTMLMSTTDPERIAGAMINDIGPVVEDAGIDRLRLYVGKAAKIASWKEAAEATASRNGIAFPDYSPEQWERFARRTYSERADGSIQADYDMAIADAFATSKGTPDYDPWPLLSGLADKPVLMQRGETSDQVSVATAERMLAELPGAELVTITGIGHAPALDEPDAVAGIERLLAKVLAEHEKGAAEAAPSVVDGGSA
jgi:pimeloyl-ACP methyl ester carboxylesterase